MMDVKAKCRKDKNTMKLNPSTSVIYLFQITIPTTDTMLQTTAVPTTKLLAMSVLLSVLRSSRRQRSNINSFYILLIPVIVIIEKIIIIVIMIEI